jgi:hypothetical protein
MAKNKRERKEASTLENQENKNQSDVIEGEYGVVTDEKEDLAQKAKDLASAGAQLAAEYAKGSLDTVGDVTIETIKTSGKMTLGGATEGFSGIGKAISGIYQTAKGFISSGSGGLIDFIVPKELKNAIVLGFKTVRAGFNADKKGGDKDKK